MNIEDAKARFVYLDTIKQNQRKHQRALQSKKNKLFQQKVCLEKELNQLAYEIGAYGVHTHLVQKEQDALVELNGEEFKQWVLSLKEKKSGPVPE